MIILGYGGSRAYPEDSLLLKRTRVDQVWYVSAGQYVGAWWLGAWQH